MALTSADVINAALEMIGEQTRISGSDPTYDGTPIAQAAGVLYRPAVEMLLRQIDPAFARTAGGLTVQLNTTLLSLMNWTGEYAYPAICLRARRVRPVPGNYDANDPKPVRSAVMIDPLTVGGPARVILTNQPSAVLVFTTGAAGVGAEALWDSGFIEAVTRRLANPLAMAIAGRPDYARELLEESAKFAEMAELAEEL